MSRSFPPCPRCCAELPESSTVRKVVAQQGLLLVVEPIARLVCALGMKPDPAATSVSSRPRVKEGASPDVPKVASCQPDKDG